MILKLNAFTSIFAGPFSMMTLPLGSVVRLKVEFKRTGSKAIFIHISLKNRGSLILEEKFWNTQKIMKR